MPLANFFAAALSQDQNRVVELFDQLTKDGSKNAKIFALHVFWIMDDKASSTYLAKAEKVWKDKEVKRIITQMNKERPRNILDNGPVTSGDLDNLWSIYFAAGNKKAIEQIASAQHLVEEGSGEQIILGGAAKWSLQSNIKQHKNVLGILKKLVEKESDVQKELLFKLINQEKDNT